MNRIVFVLILLLFAGCVAPAPKPPKADREAAMRILFSIYHKGYERGYEQAVTDCNCAKTEDGTGVL